MKEEILQKMVECYNERKQCQENYEKKKLELKELKEDPKVKEYLDLVKEVNGISNQNRNIVSWTKDDMINAAYNEYKREIVETHGIIVYMGTFMHSSERDIIHGPSYISLRRDNPKAEFRVYRDIEKSYHEEFELPIKECSEFEKNHTIIIPRTILREDYFNKLQKEFIADMIIHGQEEAVNKVLEKTKDIRLK